MKETRETTLLVDQDNATWRLDVQCEVGDLCFNCEVSVAEKLFRRSRSLAQPVPWLACKVHFAPWLVREVHFQCL
jgi:hypothetical protein